MIRTLPVHGLVDETTAVLDAAEAGDVFPIDVFLITRDGRPAARRPRIRSGEPRRFGGPEPV